MTLCKLSTVCPCFRAATFVEEGARVTFHTISHFLHFHVTKEGFRCSNVTKLDCLRSNVTKSPLTYSNVTQKQDSDREACSAYSSFIAKDCLLTSQEQACTRITWLVVCLSPCRKWPNTQTRQQDQEWGMTDQWSSQPFALLTLGLVFINFLESFKNFFLRIVFLFV